MILRNLYVLFGFRVFWAHNLNALLIGRVEELEEIVKRHYIRTASLPKLEDRFMLSATEIAVVKKVNLKHYSAILACQCFFDIIVEE